MGGVENDRVDSARGHLEGGIESCSSETTINLCVGDVGSLTDLVPARMSLFVR